MSDNGQQPTDKSAEQPKEQPKEQLRHNRDLFGTEQPEVRLPEELATSITADDAGASLEALQSLVAANLKDSGAWAALATRLLEADQPVEAYACARTGYHRGLDALRANGWRGTGPVPWDHTPNQGVLRAIGALVVTAHALQEEDEFIRCLNLLHDCDPSATDALGLGHLAS
ncbi:DUF3151 domain-containing protein [Corynebacterium falsenii]|uniref:DUF3151 domain-containing protein n=1 Tax=Corynebacterium falsenii TaxID=108486 RepID=A0A418Q5K9_9CORY|nr:DUF3151 domain-containing protein [Corynebacterium falsenii]RIX33884.1 DUF3151 domain-containing protein [Corynebacterium falsenii]